MGKFIKYKRIKKRFVNNIPDWERDINEFFDMLIKDNWEIIHYQENQLDTNLKDILEILIICGKLRNDI